MSNGVLIFEGMKVGILPGDFTIGVDESGNKNSSLILSTSYNVLPIWLRIASDNLNQSEIISNEITNKWQDIDENKRKELLVLELEPSLQVFVACGIVLDTLYDLLRPYANITDENIKVWRDNKTGRAKQIAEVIRRVFKLDKTYVKKFKLHITEIIKYRDLAVHPSHELKNSCTRPDIPEGVDWKFATYRFPNSKNCFISTLEMLKYLYKKDIEIDSVSETMENIFKALRELKVVI